MKKLQYFGLLCLLGIGLSLTAQHQPQPEQLITKLIGKWKVVKYQSSTGGVSATTDTLVFEPDGTFRSDRAYFGSNTGLFRTDETRKVLIFDVDNNTTEWAASISKGVLRMKSLPDGKRPKVHITLVSVKKEELVAN